MTNDSWAVPLGVVCLSLLAVPGWLTYRLLVRGVPESGSPEMLAVGLVAMLPGVAMGAGALYAAARN